MASASSSSKPVASTSTSEDNHTIRGRAPDAPQDQPQKSQAVRHSVPFGPPVKGRERANSLRRLDQATLAHMAGSGSEAASFGAQRELDVRGAMVAESQAQFRQERRPMAATGPAGMAEVAALRFGASMAEEAQSGLQTAPKNKKRMIGQVGVANVNGHLGFGISGRANARDFGQSVEERMLDLQQHYDGTGGSANWSTQLVPVHAPEITPVDVEDICAGKRAALTAHAANGSLQPIAPIHRANVPSPDALLEVMQGATSEFGKNVAAHSILQGKAMAEPAANPFQATITGRTRSSSVGSMASSCDTCMQEHEQHMKTRAASGKF